MTDEKNEPVAYFVTTMMVDENNPKIIVRQRTPGFFKSIEDARRCVLENWGDIYELGYYNYALVEPMREGLYPYENHDDNEWYKVQFNEEEDRNDDVKEYTITKVGVPEKLSKVVCFAIG